MRSVSSSMRTPSGSSKRSTRANLVVQSAGYPGFAPVGGDANVKVIGVGGGGGNALNRMIGSGLQVSSRPAWPASCLRLCKKRARMRACMQRAWDAWLFPQTVLERHLAI